MQRRFRLRRSADFKLLHREGRRWQHPLLVLIVRANGKQDTRFGISAGRGVGSAASRNRAKRRLREAVRRRLNEVQPGWDCLLIARRALVRASFADVNAATSELLLNAGILVVEENLDNPDRIQERSA
jgi:ribonuclease P protein component